MAARGFGREVVWIDSLLGEKRRFTGREGRLIEGRVKGEGIGSVRTRKDSMDYGEDRRGRFEHRRDLEGGRYGKKCAEKREKTSRGLPNEGITDFVDDMESSKNLVVIGVEKSYFEYGE